MFLLVIAIIAGIVLLFLAVATFVLLRAENRKNTQTLTSTEPKPIPPIEKTVASLPEEGQEEALLSIPPGEDVPAPPPKETPEDDLTVIPSADPPGSRNTLDAAIGFLGWFVINIPLWLWVLDNEPGAFTPNPMMQNPIRIIPLCLNCLFSIPVLLMLVGLKRPWIMLGIGVAILVNATLLFAGQ